MCLLLRSLVEPEEATVVHIGNRKGFRREGMTEAEMGTDGLHEAEGAGTRGYGSRHLKLREQTPEAEGAGT